MQPHPHHTHIPTATRTAHLLGYAGALPFIALCLHTWIWPEYRNFSARGLMTYSAVTITFLGAIYWGLVLQREHTLTGAAQPADLALVWSVIPTLLAWCGLMLPPQLGRYWMIVLLLLCLAVDLLAGHRWPLPRWYLRMRMVLTTIACVALLLARLVPSAD